MKASASRDISIGGPELAAHAFEAGLVDFCHLFMCPILLGEGHSGFPDHVRVGLTLEYERRFRNGMVFLGYRCAV